MNDNQDEAIWQRLSKALFGGSRTTDEGLFTYRVMEQVRRLEPALQDQAWHRFLRWMVPVLGVGVASLILAMRTPASPVWPDEDPAMTMVEDFE
jgi:hypothetical protein